MSHPPPLSAVNSRILADSWQTIVSKALVRPFALFVREPIVQLLGVYMAFIYGTLYCRCPSLHCVMLQLIVSFTVFLTTIPSIFQGVYGQPVGIAGLHYFALGVGLTGGTQINARWMYARQSLAYE